MTDRWRMRLYYLDHIIRLNAAYPGALQELEMYTMEETDTFWLMIELDSWEAKRKFLLYAARVMTLPRFKVVEEAGCSARIKCCADNEYVANWFVVSHLNAVKPTWTPEYADALIDACGDRLARGTRTRGIYPEPKGDYGV